MTGTTALLPRMALQCAGDVGGGWCMSEYGLQRVVRGTVLGRSGKRNVCGAPCHTLSHEQMP